jgi:hypothetical protein
MNRDTLENDIINFFKNIEGQNTNDKRNTLRLMMEKYLHLNSSAFLMDKHDLEMIISEAKKKIVIKSFPTHIGKNKARVNQDEQVPLAIIEAAIGFFNGNDCLKRLPEFDYREDSKK